MTPGIRLTAISPLAVLTGLALCCSTSHAAPVAVTNASFEADGTGTGTTSPTGWTKIANASWQTFGAQVPQPTEGLTHAYTNGPGAGNGSMSQITGETITDGVTYTLTVDIGQISNFTGSQGTMRLIGSTAGAGTPLSNANGTAELAGLAPASGGPYLFDQTVTYTALASGDPFAGQSIGIELVGSSGVQVLWDNVRLDAGIGDSIPPTIHTKVPGNGASGVAVDADLVATFNENVQKGTGDIVIKRFSDGVAVETIDVTTGAVTVSGKDVTINPPSDLADSTQFYVEIDPGAIEDLANNDFAGITGDADWNFTTIIPDLTDPTVLALSPVDEAVDVSAGTNLVVTFDEDVMTVAPTVLHDWDFEGSDDGFTVKVAGATGSAWEWGAPDSTSIGGDVTEGNNASTNCWGTNLGLVDDGHYEIPSTVTCLRSPVIDLTSVAGATLSFAEAMDLEGSDTAVVNIIEAATDTIIAGGAAIYTADDSSSTGDANWNDVPAIDLAVGVGQSVRIEWCLTGGTDEYLGWYIDDVQINETGLPGTSVTIKNLSDATETAIPISDSSQVSISGDTLTIDPASPLDLSKNYAIQIGASAITDLAGNPFGGILDDATWNFSTGDGLGPIAVANFSFDDDGTITTVTPTGWSSVNTNLGTRTGVSGVVPTDGTHQLWLNGGNTIYQDTGVVIELGKTYTLTVDVTTTPPFDGHTGTFRLYGSTLGFGTAIGGAEGSKVTAQSVWTTETTSFTATAAEAGQTLGIALSTTGTQTEWDNVRLEASIGGGGGLDPVITSITVNGTTATIVMKGEASTTYVCKSSDDLLTPFALIATTPATVMTNPSGNASFDVDATVARRFYLVEE